MVNISSPQTVNTEQQVMQTVDKLEVALAQAVEPPNRQHLKPLNLM